MPFIQLPSGQLHYRDAGEGSPLLLLHANPGDSRDFAAVINELAGHYRVIALDWPGYGQSPLPTDPAPANVTLGFYQQVLEEFIDAMNLQGLVLVGNSVGGLCAVEYAARHQDRVIGLILVSPGGFTPHNGISNAFCQLQGSRFSLPPSLWARLYLNRWNSATRAMLERARTEQSAADTRQLNRALWRGFLSPEGDVVKSAAQIDRPVLLMFGQHDPAISARRDGRTASRAFSRADTLVLPCGHAAFAELPQEFCQHAMRFLRQKVSLSAEPEGQAEQ